MSNDNKYNPYNVNHNNKHQLENPPSDQCMNYDQNHFYQNNSNHAHLPKNYILVPNNNQYAVFNHHQSNGNHNSNYYYAHPEASSQIKYNQHTFDQPSSHLDYSRDYNSNGMIHPYRIPFDNQQHQAMNPIHKETQSSLGAHQISQSSSSLQPMWLSSSMSNRHVLHPSSNMTHLNQIPKVNSQQSQASMLKQNIQIDLISQTRHQASASMYLIAKAFNIKVIQFQNNRLPFKEESDSLKRNLVNFENKIAKHFLKGEIIDLHGYTKAMKQREASIQLKLNYFEKMEMLSKIAIPIIKNKFFTLYNNYSSFSPDQQKKVKTQLQLLKQYKHHLDHPERIHQTKGLAYIDEIIQEVQSIDFHGAQQIFKQNSNLVTGTKPHSYYLNSGYAYSDFDQRHKYTPTLVNNSSSGRNNIHQKSFNMAKINDSVIYNDQIKQENNNSHHMHQSYPNLNPSDFPHVKFNSHKQKYGISPDGDNLFHDSIGPMFEIEDYSARGALKKNNIPSPSTQNMDKNQNLYKRKCSEDFKTELSNGKKARMSTIRSNDNTFHSFNFLNKNSMTSTMINDENTSLEKNKSEIKTPYNWGVGISSILENMVVENNINNCVLVCSEVAKDLITWYP